MAISVEKKVNESVVNYGLVNNVLQYNGVSKLSAVSSDIEFAGLKLTIRPAPDMSFFYNLKDFISALMTAKGFQDDLDIDIDSNGIVYDFTNFSLLRGNIKVSTLLEDSSVEVFYNSVHFLNAVKQKEDLNKRQPNNFGRNLIFPLSPLLDNSNRKMFLDYWEGYPLDITIHKGTGNSETKFLNNNNLSEISFTTGVNEIVSRYVVSDGRTDLALENAFNLNNGLNSITVSSGSDSYEMELYRHPICEEGTYIKWLNNDGGYSYYFFKFSERTRKTSELGDLENDYYNIEDTISPTVSIGKESNDELRVTATSVRTERQIYLNDLIDSPAVFLFTGIPFSKNTYKDWLSIKLKTNSVKLSNAKQKLMNYDFVFELPKRNTRTL